VDGDQMIWCMPRKTFSQRHRETEPPAPGPATIDAIIALHHPVRRRLYESLGGLGPAPVGVLARRCRVAAGSASHHLGVLHRGGWVEPAPELAGATRESWWRARHIRLSWDSDEYPPGTAGRAVLDLAAREQAASDFRSVLAWMDASDDLPPAWAHSVSSAAFVLATPHQLVDLGQRLSALVDDWATACIRDREQDPDAERRTVRVIARAFPSDPQTS
jgi:Helix-turn-helix domain